MTEREHSGPDSRRVQQMFAGIAHRYDFLNHFLSFSIDRYWRRIAVAKVRQLLAPRQPSICLDVCSGTGDLAILLHRTFRCQVVASDFCHPMLTRATAKCSGLNVGNVEGDALNLPFSDSSFDALTIAFGLRNLEDSGCGLREMVRVLKPGGVIVILEFSRPVVPIFKHVFNFYFRRVLPRIGAAISGDGAAYRYLPDSVRSFPDQNRLAQLMAANGFSTVGYTNLSGGIAAMHWGKK
jgi:demethylmenaquinone methyltransferase / 2-methoxy-6-polyprenyl-1,4-benzoquinol methylase